MQHNLQHSSAQEVAKDDKRCVPHLIDRPTPVPLATLVNLLENDMLSKWLLANGHIQQAQLLPVVSSQYSRSRTRHKNTLFDHLFFQSAN